MSSPAVAALVVLPVALFGAALALASVRAWLGITVLPRARHVVRAVRRAAPGGPRRSDRSPRSDRGGAEGRRDQA